MTSKQQLILAVGGLAAFAIVQKKKTGAAIAKSTGRGIPTAPGTGSTPNASKPNTTNLATRNGTALTPQAPSTIARVLSGVSMGLHDLSNLFHRTGQPTNARPTATAGSGAPSGSSASSGSSGNGNVPGIPPDATPEYDTFGNLIGYDDGTSGEFVDLRTPAYDSAGNEIGYYDAAGNFAGESVLFDPTTPTTTDLPSMGSGSTDTSAPTPGINADGSPSNDGPAIEQVNDDPTHSWFNPPAPDTSAVSVDSAADTAVTDRNVYDDAWFASQPDVFVGNDLTPNDPGYWEPNFAGNPYEENADDITFA